MGPVGRELLDDGVAVTALGAQSPADLPRVTGAIVDLVAAQRIDTVFSFLIHANAAAALASLGTRGVRYLQSIQTTQPRPAWHWTLQRIVARAAERIIVPSPSVAQIAADRCGIAAEKIVVIANAVEPRLFRIDRQPCEVPRIGFIGRLDPVKCVGDLIEAVAMLPPRVRLEIYGDGPERPGLERLVAQLGLGGRVTFHGAVERPQEALASIDLLVLPSQAEGFGLVLIEAMAAGVPVVATNVAGIRDVVRDGETGLLVPPHSPQALADAITRVFGDAGLQQRLTDAGRADVNERFAWNRVIERYRELLA
jgi:glycosyltransferase involved in cell wall biosynthesis